MKKSLLPFLLATLFVSCTHIIATNYPGTPKDRMPDSWTGKYEATLPGFLMMAAPNGSSTVTISRNRLEWKQADQTSVYSLSDSLRYTQVGNDSYISLHNSHGNYTIFKVKNVKDGLHLYAMTAEEEIEGDQLKPFFKTVTEHYLDSGKNDTGIRLYEVTIDDSKLDDYYNSGIPGSSPIKLKRIKD